MKNATNGKPTRQWTYLRTFAMAGGCLPVHHTNVRETSKHQKKKQTLSKALTAAFGITSDPIPADGNDYTTRFVLSAEDLNQGKQGQRQRNFGQPM